MPAITRLLPWPPALLIAWVYLSFLPLKWGGNEGSVFLFTTLTDWMGLAGYEKPMRLGVGAAELVASLLLLTPWTQMLGAGLSLGIISGAIFFHLVSPLGVDPFDDGGSLFIKACAVWVLSAAILWLRRDEVMRLLARLGILPAAAAV